MNGSSLYAKLRSSLKKFERSTAIMYSSSLKFRIGFTLITAIVALGLVSLATPPYHWQWYKLPKDQPPSLSSIDMIFGTTTNGRSVFWASSNAIINSLTIGLLTALIASHIGLLIGLVAGYKGGLIDRILMLFTDSFVVIPSLPLLIVLSMLLKEVVNIPLLGILIGMSPRSQEPYKHPHTPASPSASGGSKSLSYHQGI